MEQLSEHCVEGSMSSKQILHSFRGGMSTVVTIWTLEEAVIFTPQRSACVSNAILDNDIPQKGHFIGSSVTVSTIATGTRLCLFAQDRHKS
jgi:hypothetical protein